jgi:hypothetical protein
LPPVHAGSDEVTVKMASMTASLDLKKNWMPFFACCSVRYFGSVGMSLGLPRTVPLNVRVLSFTWTVESISASFEGLNGVL